MDIQAYIQSGIIESYVLGLTTAEETAEVEQLSLQHTEVQKAIDDFATVLEQQAMQNAVPPPASVKERIMAAIAEEKTVTPMPVLGQSQGVSESSANVVTERNNAPAVVRRIQMWKYVAAASVILFIASAAYNVYLYNQYSDQRSEYLSLLNDRNTLQANNNIYETKIKELQQASDMIINPAMAKVKMSGVKNKQDEALVLWDTRTKDVYLVSNKLPSPQSGKQYQLWAIVDGKPVDAGMVDENCNTVCKLKNIPEAQAFAITLENLGGSPNPTMEELYVMGEI